MEATDIRTVYDFPVAGHLCSDGVVHYVKLTRRSGNPKPEGVCSRCQIRFQYEKPQRVHSITSQDQALYVSERDPCH